MKSIRTPSFVIGAVLFASAGSALAVDLIIASSPVATGLNPSNFNPAPSISGFTPTNGTIGVLEIDGPGVVTYTYLGKEAGFSNKFINVGGSTTPMSTSSTPPGTASVQAYNAMGILNFSFGTDATTTVTNGSATNTSPTFAIFSGGSSGYKWVLGYDDSGAGPDRDFDDMVIGVNVAAVPEPEAYGLALAGMGVVAFAMRRRRSAEKQP